MNTVDRREERKEGIALVYDLFHNVEFWYKVDDKLEWLSIYIFQV